MNDWQKLKRHKLEVPPSLAETTSNLQLPEVIGKKVDKRTLRKTGRTEQFATRVSKEWLEKVKGIAERENLKLVEVLEKLLESYEKKPTKEAVKENFSFNSEISSTREKNLSELADNSEQFTHGCSFFLEGMDEKMCDKPLFDKKKQLCRSHNKQVWKKFNAFLKGKSVSSDTAWLGTWQESGDWEYFWGLGVEREKNENKN